MIDINEYIAKLVKYGENTEIINKYDKVYVINSLLELFEFDDYYDDCYNLDDLDRFLKEEGPMSYNYRKLLSYITDVRRKTWDKLDKINSAHEIYEAIQWVINNNVYLGVHKGKEFLETDLGRSAILNYAMLNGLDYHDKFDEWLRKKGYYNPNEFDYDKYMKGLMAIPFEFFERILKEVEEKQKIERSHNTRR